MESIDEKRIYGDRTGAREGYVASDTGLVRLRVTADAIGEFSLADRRSARDVALAAGPAREESTDGPSLAVATAEDVLVGAAVEPADPDEQPREDLVLEETGFGPSVAVGFGPTGLVAASPNGALAGYGDDGWRSLVGPADVDGSAPLSIRAIDGELVGTDRGVYRLDGDRLRPVGLDDVRDVDATGTPLAATGVGLYALGPGWVRTFEGAVEAVAAAPSTDEDGRDRAIAAVGSSLYEHAGASIATDGGEWRELASADGPIAGIARGEPGYVYAVTTGGTVLAVGPDGARTRSIGVRNVAGIVVR
ncbi:hypothetical protein [Halovivax sp.]|uniref:HVO_0234 family beta-propeller protein n=1 Tax=Halovivax sp. TaxID=1935978 RepID=UPI0025C08A4A|nr:hypothetical protein [Halovivax sp.]